MAVAVTAALMPAAVSAMSPFPNKAFRVPDRIRVTQKWLRATQATESVRPEDAAERTRTLPARIEAGSRPRAWSRGVQVGQTYRAAVTQTRRGETIVTIGEKVVRLDRAELGEEVTFIVTDDLGDHAAGYVLSHRKLGTSRPPDKHDEIKPTNEAGDVTEGSIHKLLIAKQQPLFADGTALAWVGSLPVVVRGAAPGEHVMIRIIERHPDWAIGEVLREERDPFRPAGRDR